MYSAIDQTPLRLHSALGAISTRFEMKRSDYYLVSWLLSVFQPEFPDHAAETVLERRTVNTERAFSKRPAAVRCLVSPRVGDTTVMRRDVAWHDKTAT